MARTARKTVTRTGTLSREHWEILERIEGAPDPQRGVTIRGALGKMGAARTTACPAHRYALALMDLCLWDCVRSLGESPPEFVPTYALTDTGRRRLDDLRRKPLDTGRDVGP